MVTNYTISLSKRWVYSGCNFENISLQVLNSVVRKIYIFFKEILNSNFNKTGIVKETNGFILANKDIYPTLYPISNQCPSHYTFFVSPVRSQGNKISIGFLHSGLTMLSLKDQNTEMV